MPISKRSLTRRQLLRGLGATAGAGLAFRAPLNAAAPKPLRGIFPIMATPYSEAGPVDFEDLGREVDFLERCGVHGMVWPQNASGYRGLTREERTRGMEVLAKAARGRKPALVLGVQAADTGQMLAFAHKAEELGPDALIAMPPYEAKSLEEYHAYYAALARLTRRPVFIQTTGGARGLDPPVEFLIALAKEFPHLGYVKEEISPVFDRMKELIKARPAIKGVFSGGDGVGLTYEMRFGGDGTMPSAPFSDVEVAVWDLYHSGRKEKARAAFASLLLMINAMHQLRGVAPYIMKKRGVFKSMMGRGRGGEPQDFKLAPEEIAEIDWSFESIKPYLRA